MRLLAAVLAATVAGCSNLGYYFQAIGGHLDIVRASVPISDLMHDPASDPGLKQKLEDVQAIREFASRELSLPDNSSYRAYADLGRPYVVWNVFAAPELSLKPKQWCMMMVGCVSYRGYYDRRDAEQLAAQLRLEGYDTFIGGVSAYSTLGFFADPVLNTFLRLGTPEVARTVFHELAHQLVYARDDTQFNESFATAVENEGMQRWLAGHATPAERAAFAARQARKAAFAALMGDYKKKFQALYATPRSADQQRRAKASLFDDLRHDYAELKAGWNGFAGYDRVMGDDLNNGTLVSYALYHGLVPAFEALLAQENHDLPLFYRRVADLAKLDKQARCDALTQLLGAADGAQPAARNPVDCKTQASESADQEQAAVRGDERALLSPASGGRFSAPVPAPQP